MAVPLSKLVGVDRGRRHHAFLRDRAARPLASVAQHSYGSSDVASSLRAEAHQCSSSEREKEEEKKRGKRVCEEVKREKKKRTKK